MAFRDAIQAPDLPALERQALPQDGELLLSVALVEPDGGGSVSARRHGVLGVESLRGLRMPWTDAVASAAAMAAALGIVIEKDLDHVPGGRGY